MLTLTPQIIRFPDIEAEDLAPVWVGTESRISYSGTRPRVQSGRAPTGPFDEQSGAESGEDQEPYGRPGTRRPTAPRRVEPEQQTPNTGIELVPPPQNKSLSSEDISSKDIGWEDVPEFEPTESIDPSLPPMLVGLEPSVVSLRPGQETVLQIVARGGTGSFRLPVGLSYDPTRVWIHDILPAPGVEVLRNTVDPVGGWVDLEVVVVDDGSSDGTGWPTHNAYQSQFAGGGGSWGSGDAILAKFAPAVPAPGALQFSASGYAALEGGPAATVTVTRTGGSAGAVSVDYATADGTATAGADYTAANGTVNFADGDATPQTFDITILDDTAF